jgi:hypothetical protein
VVIDIDGVGWKNPLPRECRWACAALPPAPVPDRTKQQAFNPRFTRGLFVACCVSRHCTLKKKTALKGAPPSG